MYEYVASFLHKPTVCKLCLVDEKLKICDFSSLTFSDKTGRTDEQIVH